MWKCKIAYFLVTTKKNQVSLYIGMIVVPFQLFLAKGMSTFWRLGMRTWHSVTTLLSGVIYLTTQVFVIYVVGSLWRRRKWKGVKLSRQAKGAEKHIKAQELSLMYSISDNSMPVSTPTLWPDNHLFHGCRERIYLSRGENKPVVLRVEFTSNYFAS